MTSVPGSEKKDGGSFRFRRGILGVFCMGSVQHFSCSVRRSNNSCSDFACRPIGLQSFFFFLVFTLSPLFFFSGETFKFFCKYFRWLTFRFDPVGRSRASLIPLDALSTKFNKLFALSSAISGGTLAPSAVEIAFLLSQLSDATSLVIGQ